MDEPPSSVSASPKHPQHDIALHSNATDSLRHYASDYPVPLAGCRNDRIGTRNQPRWDIAPNDGGPGEAGARARALVVFVLSFVFHCLAHAQGSLAADIVAPPMNRCLRCTACKLQFEQFIDTCNKV